MRKAFTEYGKYKEAKKLTESQASPELDSLLKDIEMLFQRTFSRSLIRTSFSTHLVPSATVTITLGDGRNEYSNGIIQNDPMHMIFMIHGMDNDGNFSELNVERIAGAGLMVPSEEPHLAYGRVKVPFRKTKGDANTVLRAFDRFFGKLQDAVRANLDKIVAPFEVHTKIR